jgi:lipopolysaccharide export system permease protein
LNILQKYILREWAWTFMAVSFVLLIVIMGVFLGDMFNDIADGRMPPGLVGVQLMLSLPSAAGEILPLAGFVAIMWGLGRLYRDQISRSKVHNWNLGAKPIGGMLRARET